MRKHPQKGEVTKNIATSSWYGEQSHHLVTFSPVFLTLCNTSLMCSTIRDYNYVT